MQMRWVLVMLAASVLSACTGTPSGLDVVDDFDVDRYLGKWYEIARLDHRFERGLDCVSADYSLGNNGDIRVLNRGVNLAEGKVSQAEGRARSRGEPDRGALKVSFFGPFFSGYNIVMLDDEYRWAMVSGYNRNYLWLLAREPEPDEAVIATLVEQAARMGFDVQALIYVDQGSRCEPWR